MLCHQRDVHGSLWIYVHTFIHMDIWHVKFVWSSENQLLSYLKCTEALPANFQHYKTLLFTMICLCGCAHMCMHIHTCVVYTHNLYIHTFIYISVSSTTQFKSASPEEQLEKGSASLFAELKSTYIALLSRWCEDSVWISLLCFWRPRWLQKVRC